jgi:lantibiotic biosynthesis protein
MTAAGNRLIGERVQPLVGFRMPTRGRTHFDRLSSFDEQSLASLAADAELIHAVTVSKPALAKKLVRRAAECDSSALRALLSYALRMCTRCTPRGLFAGGGIVTLTNRLTSDRLSDESMRVTARPALGLLARILEHVEQLAIRNRNPALMIRSNPTGYEVDPYSLLRFDEVRSGKGDTISRAQVPSSAELLTLFEQFSEPCTVAQAAERLRDIDPALGYSEAHDLIFELLQTGVLVSELYVAPNTDDPWISAYRELKPISEDWAGALLQIRELAQEWKSRPYPGFGLDQLHAAIAQSVTRLGIVGFQETSTIAPVAHLAGTFSLPTAFIDSVGLDYRAALGLFEAQSDDDLLTDWISRFQQKFGEGWVRVPLALDPDLGAPWHGQESNTCKPVDWNSVRLRTYVEDECYARKSVEDGPVVISKDFVADKRRPIDGLELIGLLSATPDLRFAPQDATAFSGAAAFAPFAHCAEFKQPIRRYLSDCEKALTVAGKTLIEVLSAPSPTHGDVLARSQTISKRLRLFAGREDKDDDNSLQLSDFQIRVRKETMIEFRDATNHRALVPVISARAFAPPDVPVMRFLDALRWNEARKLTLPQIQESAEDGVFRPEIQFGTLILRPAGWRLAGAAWRSMLQSKSPARSFMQWAERFNVTRYVRAGEADHRLVIDRSSLAQCEALLHATKHLSELILDHFCWKRHAVAASASDSRPVELMVSYPPECLASIEKDHDSAPPIIHLHKQDWLSLHLTINPESTDHFLRIWLPQSLADTPFRNARDRWFFVRQSDPSYHLRIRFRGDKEELGHLESLLLQRLASLVSHRIVSRVWFDCYVPETGRFGGKSLIGTAERVFSVDTVMALGGQRGNGRIENQIAVATAGLLTFACARDRPINVTAGRIAALMRAHRPACALSHEGRAINYARIWQDIQPLLRETQQTEDHATAQIDLADLLAEYRGQAPEVEERVFDSFLHMHINRCLTVRHDTYEPVVYYCGHRSLMQLSNDTATNTYAESVLDKTQGGL